MPKENIRVFGKGNIHSFKATYSKMRKRLAFKLQNPRLLRIGFHTFRHWKATQLYHETKDPWYVKQFLGHKCLKSTEVYINIERSTFESTSDSFIVKVVQTPEEIQQLLETGFEYICQKDNLIFLRKRKYGKLSQNYAKPPKCGRGEVHSAISGDVSHNQFSFFSCSLESDRRSFWECTYSLLVYDFPLFANRRKS